MTFASLERTSREKKMYKKVLGNGMVADIKSSIKFQF